MRMRFRASFRLLLFLSGIFGTLGVFGVWFPSQALGQNKPPSAPIPRSPVQGEIIPFPSKVKLDVQAALDPDGDAMLYHFQVSTDKAFQTVLVEADGIKPYRLGALWSPPGLQHAKIYYWRARAFDATDYGPWSEIWSFIVDEDLGQEAPKESVVEAPKEASSEPSLEAALESSLEKKPEPPAFEPKPEPAREKAPEPPPLADGSAEAPPDAVTKEAGVLEIFVEAPQETTTRPPRAGCRCSSDEEGLSALSPLPSGLFGVSFFFLLLLLSLRRQAK